MGLSAGAAARAGIGTGGAGTAPTSAAGAAAPPGTYYAPPAGSVQSTEDYTAANQAYQQALARFNQQRTGLLQQYGYKGTVDPSTGLMTNVGVDTGNVNGQLQQLLGQQDQEDQNAEFGMEDRGIVGGLANQAQTNLRSGHSAQTSGLAQQLLGSLSGLNDQQVTAKQTLDQALWQSQQDAAQQAIDAGEYNPADLSSLVASLTGSKAATSTAGKTAVAAPNSKLNLAAPTAVLKPKVSATTTAQKKAIALAAAARARRT